MKIIILAGGYGTRLYPLTFDKPKPLLPVGGRPIIEHLLDKIKPISAVDRIFIITNHKFFRYFNAWVKKLDFSIPIKVIDDGTLSNEDRLGGIGDIGYLLKTEKLEEDLLIIGGDNLLDAQINDFLEFAVSKDGFCCLGLYDLADMELAKMYGVVAIDIDGKLIDFAEKPAQPKSTLIATCIYYYPLRTMVLLREYLQGPLTKDATGNYIKWLYKKEPVYGYVFKGKWYDIGDMESYKKAQEEYSKERTENRAERTEKTHKDIL